MIRVRDVMTSPVKTLPAHASLATALDVMNAAQIRHLPVVGRDGQLLGLISQRDILRHSLAEASLEDQRAYLASVQVEAVMALIPQTIRSDADLSMAARTMLMLKYGCLPVVDHGKLVGILTEADFLQLVV